MPKYSTRTKNPIGTRTNVGKVYAEKRWAKRWAMGRPIRKVRGGWQIMAGEKKWDSIPYREYKKARED